MGNLAHKGSVGGGNNQTKRLRSKFSHVTDVQKAPKCQTKGPQSANLLPQFWYKFGVILYPIDLPVRFLAKANLQPLSLVWLFCLI